MTIVLALLFIAAMGFLNRCRGDDRWMPAWFRGRALYYIAPVVALGATIWLGWLLGLLFGLWYLGWATPPWGYLQLLGRPVDGKRPEPFEAFLLRIARGNVYLAFTLRHSLAGPLAPFIVAGYELGWRLSPGAPIIVGEVIAGMLWGLMIVLVNGAAP